MEDTALPGPDLLHSQPGSLRPSPLPVGGGAHRVTGAGLRSPHLDHGRQPGTLGPAWSGRRVGLPSPAVPPVGLQRADPLTKTMTAQPHFTGDAVPGIVSSIPYISSFNPKKCYYSLFTDHEMEAQGVKGLSKIIQQ